MANRERSPIDPPDVGAIRSNALGSGGIDPVTLRFRVVEYDKFTGQLLGIPVEDLGFFDAVETTKGLIEDSEDSHFLLEPIGFVQ